MIAIDKMTTRESADYASGSQLVNVLRGLECTCDQLEALAQANPENTRLRLCADEHWEGLANVADELHAKGWAIGPEGWVFTRGPQLRIFQGPAQRTT